MSSKNSTEKIIANQHIDQRSAFENTFEDALALTTDTRDFFAEKSLSLRSESQLPEQLREVVILSKLTLCLMCVMDWVVAQKAAIANTSECGQVQKCLPQLSVCDDDLAGFPAKDEGYSERLNDLIDRTISMFSRVVRLNEMRDAIDTGTPRRRPSEIPRVEGPENAASGAHSMRE